MFIKRKNQQRKKHLIQREMTYTITAERLMKYFIHNKTVDARVCKRIWEAKEKYSIIKENNIFANPLNITLKEIDIKEVMESANFMTKEAKAHGSNQ